MKASERFGWPNHPLVQLTLWRLREFRREPEAVFWVFIFPILVAAGLGLAFRKRPAEVLTVATVRPELVKSLRQEKLLDVKQLTATEAQNSLRTGKVALVAFRVADATVLYQYDDTNPQGRGARLLADRVIQRSAAKVDPVAVIDVPVVERGSRYIDFLIPGLLGMNLMLSAISGVGSPIVDARRKKLMKRLIASPMPRHFYLLSFLFARLFLQTLEVGTLLAFGICVFQVPVRGCWLSLLVIGAAGSFSFSALGLLIASRVRTTEAASGLMNAVVVLGCVVCGVFFSAQRFPGPLQLIVRFLPLTAVIDALRANKLGGASLLRLAPELGVLAAWLVVCLALALKLFRWKSPSSFCAVADLALRRPRSQNFGMCYFREARAGNCAVAGPHSRLTGSCAGPAQNQPISTPVEPQIEQQPEPGVPPDNIANLGSARRQGVSHGFDDSVRRHRCARRSGRLFSHRLHQSAIKAISFEINLATQIVGFAPALFPDRRGNGTGLDERNRDPPGMELHPQRVGNRLHGKRGGVVGGRARQRISTSDGADIHNPAAAAAQKRKTRLHHRNQAEHVDLELPAPRVERQQLERSRRCNSSVVGDPDQRIVTYG
jgi:ABC-type polysaccharide/polyol phosphate export permease